MWALPVQCGAADLVVRLREVHQGGMEAGGAGGAVAFGVLD